MGSLKSTVRRWPLLAPALIAGLPAVASAQDRPVERQYIWWLPENVFPAAEGIDALFYGILYLTCFVCIGVFAALIFFLIKYRYRPGRHALFMHGNTRLELVWTLIPTLILALIAAVSQTSWAKVKRPPMTPTTDQVLRGEIVEMRVVGKQFKWYFQYPGKDGKLGPLRQDLQRGSMPDELIGLDRSTPEGRDDIVTPLMYLPVNKPAYVHLGSVDVLHSFFLPEFRIKQDAVPGVETRVWLESSKTSAATVGYTPVVRDGRIVRRDPKPFEIVCAELCGQGHFTMRGELYIVSQDEYDAWLAREYDMLGLDEEGEDAGY